MKHHGKEYWVMRKPTGRKQREIVQPPVAIRQETKEFWVIQTVGDEPLFFNDDEGYFGTLKSATEFDEPMYPLTHFSGDIKCVWAKYVVVAVCVEER